MTPNLIVIDGFYKDPHAVRKKGLSCEYLPSSSYQDDFPGKESRHSFFTKVHKEKFEHLIGTSIHFDPSRESFGVFSLTSKCDEKKAHFHVDHSDWTGIVYLSLDQDCVGSTQICKHRKTGRKSMPRDAHCLKEFGTDSSMEFYNRFIVPDQFDTEKWDVSLQVGVKFNRLVLFRASELFHRASEFFGSTPKNSRLMQLFFFNEASNV